MRTRHHPRGSLILEAVIATAVTALFISAIAGIAITTTTSGIDLHRNQEAIWSAHESIDAIRSVNFSNLTPTTDATISYDDINHIWTIGSGGPEVLANGLTRDIDIEAVERDASCNIVASGGEVDPDTVLVTSTLSWTSTGGRTRSVTSEEIVTNWQSPVGECFAPQAASQITLDVSGAYWGGSKQLRGITVTNNSSFDLTVTHITMTWNEPESEMQQIFFGEGKIWSNSGPGTPSGTQESGTLIDALDTVLLPGEMEDAYKIQFTEEMDNDTTILTISFTFDDGSVFTSEPFTPLDD